MSIEEKRKILETLEKDVEFRYALMGLLGYRELLDRFSRLEEEQRKLWENQNRLWENQNKLWENISRLWEEVRSLREETKKLWESQNKLWEEVRALREGQNKLWENQNKLWENQNRLWEEVKSLREGQNKLWENVNRLWEEVKALREGQNKLWEEVRSLREGQNKLWEEVKALREGQNKLWEEVRNLKVSHERLEKYVRSGFRELRRVLGSTFEDYIAAFVEVMLEDRGFKDVSVGRKFLVYGGEVLEINLFCEKPLVVGEVTLKVEDVRGAEEEVMKLLKRVEVVKEVYKAEPVMKVLAVGRVSVEASKVLRELAEKYGIKLLIGSEIDWEY
ncbi:MAG: hypothetical protein LM560_04970 [Desulfurococcaceae archaeon]|nr:hypothetical protein [Desulfurococcaceae archaeon]